MEQDSATEDKNKEISKLDIDAYRVDFLNRLVERPRCGVKDIIQVAVKLPWYVQDVEDILDGTKIDYKKRFELLGERRTEWYKEYKELISGYLHEHILTSKKSPNGENACLIILDHAPIDPMVKIVAQIKKYIEEPKTDWQKDIWDLMFPIQALYELLCALDVECAHLEEKIGKKKEIPNHYSIPCDAEKLNNIKSALEAQGFVNADTPFLAWKYYFTGEGSKPDTKIVWLKDAILLRAFVQTLVEKFPNTTAMEMCKITERIFENKKGKPYDGERLYHYKYKEKLSDMEKIEEVLKK